MSHNADGRPALRRAELSQRPKLNIATKALVKGAMAFIVGGRLARSCGVPCTTGDDVAFPSATGVDLFVATTQIERRPIYEVNWSRRIETRGGQKIAGHNAGAFRRGRHDLHLNLAFVVRGLHEVARREHAHRVAFLGVARSVRNRSASRRLRPGPRRRDEKSATGCATAAAGTRRSRASPSEAITATQAPRRRT